MKNNYFFDNQERGHKNMVFCDLSAYIAETYDVTQPRQSALEYMLSGPPPLFAPVIVTGFAIRSLAIRAGFGLAVQRAAIVKNLQKSALLSLPALFLLPSLDEASK